ncbi:MAG: hypothetical protein FD123_2616 [Bacteroidetes bacterium]|nr:MAG: hypothetical protein FD123_2616 [Bacteroidota bacterium]
MAKLKVAFVINPKSGTDKKTDRSALIRGLISPDYESVIFDWNKLEDRDAIFAEVKNGGFDIALAAGGDGTVNQLADALSGTSTALGILPFGSGNGLARHLGISLKTDEAMHLVGSGKLVTMDRGLINGKSFFCTAGVGFDAHIGKLFAESSTRGFSTYLQMTLREFSNYKSEIYTISIDGKIIEREAFLITAANAGQYGNNAWIAPAAIVNDGLLHLSILKPFRWWNIPRLGSSMLSKKIFRSRFFESFTGKKIVITRNAQGPTHFDGEPDMMGTKLEIEIDPAALKILVPQHFTG